MLGTYQNVRKTPESSRTTKLQRATSPSMNDQWSGKTLRRFFFISVARPSRSSAHEAAAPARFGLLAVAAEVLLSATLLVSMLIGGPIYSGARALVAVALPVARSDWFEEVALGDQVALVVDHQRKLGEGARGGAEDHLGGVREIE